MAKTPYGKLRIMYLAKFLFERTDEEHGASLGEITDYLAAQNIVVERKTLYDDIETLRADFGMDIVLERGAKSEYRLVSREFEVPEVKLLADAVSSSKFITEKKSAELIGKLGTLVSEHSRSLIRRQIFVDNRVKSMNESIYLNIDALQTAISSRKKVTFLYADYTVEKKLAPRHGGKLYSVSPLGMRFNDGNYYLAAYNDERGAVNNYRIDRMLKVTVSDEAFAPAANDPDFDLSKYWREQFSMFGGEHADVRLIFDNDLAGVALDRFGKESILVPYDEGRFSLNIGVEISQNFFGWLVQFGDKVKIDSPDEVARQFTELLHRAAKIYE